MTWICDFFKKKKDEPMKEEPKLVIPSQFSDVSKYRVVDYEKFDEQVLVTRATWGFSKDVTLDKNKKECAKRNINLGAYHFYHTSKAPIAQADFYLDTFGVENIQKSFTGWIIDWETSDSAGNTMQGLKENMVSLLVMCRYLHGKTGVVGTIYCNDHTLGEMPWPKDIIKYAPRLWIARYSGEFKKENLEKSPWQKYWAHQYTDHAKVPWSKEGVDRSYYFGE